MTKTTFVGFRTKSVGGGDGPVAHHDGEKKDGPCHRTPADHVVCKKKGGKRLTFYEKTVMQEGSWKTMH